ncbi:hypothetical protein K491DRAFT_683928 [Lophiostoma macrostomum CBS 122681]|uniref:Adhesin domain-containing protein n=1 Tax=Lophiostoma macrostomum CBS 122681 TaxID=1314788 RepID=A0A6A6SN93_9PLEO|nr:hypothetical protein K491DRAFT_683928 [Lophiostoma macrostomum CBS 122681]
MFIDTDAANQGTKFQITAASPKALDGPSKDVSPEMESFLGQEAPPSYLEATTPRPWIGRPSGDEEARLLSFDGRTSPPPVDGSWKDFYYRRRGFREHWTRRRMLRWGIVSLIIILLLVILIVVSSRKPPATTIAAPPQPAQSATPSHTPENYPIRWPARCGKDYNVKTEEFSYGSPSEFQVKESMSPFDTFKTVSGWIHVVRAPSSQAAGTIQVKFAYAVSSAVDVNSIAYKSSATGLTIGHTTSTGVMNALQQKKNCLGMSVVVYVAPGAQLDTLNVAAVHLGMQVHAGVDFSVANETAISLTSGTLDASSFKSRVTKLETISGSISGKYPLLDSLSVSTMSGSVYITVAPEENAEGNPQPALFSAQSVSGSIRADFERKRIPERDYQITIDTKAGSVGGELIHGSKTTLSSLSGSITADVLPLGFGDETSTLETSTRAGLTEVTVQPPYKKAEAGMSKLVSSHKSISGNINLTYPQEWEGRVDGSSVIGEIHLEGKDLELLEEVKDPGSFRVAAKKGEGKSRMDFETVDGACDVRVGKL